jgi:rhomboid protease GluP
VSDPLGGLEPIHEPAPQPEPTPQPLQRRRTPTTFALLLVFGAFFVAEALVGHDWSVQSSVALIRLGALYGPAVRDGDWWRIGSYAFLHIGWPHILANSWSLWVLAPQLEMTFGSNITLGLFAATALAGGGASALWNLHLGRDVLAAGASGGVMGLFGATIALFWRVRERIPPEARRRIVRTVGLNVLLIVAIAYTAPVDNAAHAGGAGVGLLLGLLAPLLLRERKPWHAPVQWLIIGCALVLAGMEGAAVAWAVHPKPRTLRGNGVEAQVPGLLLPVEPGLALLPGAAAVEISRSDEPLRIEPGETAARIGDRTWLVQHPNVDGEEITELASADGGGRVTIRFQCGAPFCRGAEGEKIYRLVAGSLKTSR